MSKLPYLEVVLPAGVPGARCDREVDEVPGEDERREPRQVEARRERVREVIQVLNRVHGHSGEGLRIGVAVMQLVDIGVDGPDVQEA